MQPTLEQIIINNAKPNSDFYAIISKFSLKAFYQLLPHLQPCRAIKIIINNPQIPTQTEHQETPSYKINEIETQLLTSAFELQLKNDLLDFYKAKAVKNFIEQKVEIKITRESQSFNFIVVNQTLIQHVAFLTMQSLASNDFPPVVTDNPSINWHKQRFQNFWLSNELTKDYTQHYLDKLEQIFEMKHPQMLYHFSLMHIFANRLKDYQNSAMLKVSNYQDSLIYQQLYRFQRNAVHEIIEKINKHNGCILADAVGLGKTYEALAVIKYFELERKNVLVLCPKKLSVNWRRFNSQHKNNPFLADGKFNYDVLNHTDLGRTGGESHGIDLSKHIWSNYDLVVIDESHNFRNRSLDQENYREGEKIKSQRYDKLMRQVILNGRKTAVLLLTATPVNNRMQDISNQISLITGDQDDFFNNPEYQIKSVRRVCYEAEQQAQKWNELSQTERTTETFQKMVGFKFRNLVDLVTIARSRRQIKQNYKMDNLTFPERLKPIELKPEIDTQGSIEDITHLNQNLKGLCFAAYKVWDYIKDERLEYYEGQYRLIKKLSERVGNFRGRENVAALMRTNILKRFESSVHAFKLTINKILASSKERRNSLEASGSTATLNLEDDIEDERDFELMLNNWIDVPIKDLDISKLKAELDHDIKLLEAICAKFSPIDYNRDAKLRDVTNVIRQKIQKPLNANNQKVIIFTSFIDTAQYIYEYLKEQLVRVGIYCGLVTGETATSNHPQLEKSKLEIDDLLTYFSPGSKAIGKRGLDTTIKLDVLVATDCISEGQDLQDCDFVINYDIHWNPVRIIQRAGRIDRLQSPNRTIQIVNVWPNVELDKYIKLEPKIAAKLQKVAAAGAKDFEEESLKHQLEQLNQGSVDLEDIKGELSFASLTLSEFTSDLKLGLSNNRKLTGQPSGIFAIAKANATLTPGIIFLFKLTRTAQPSDENQINPYYLVYTDSDHNIKFNYTQASEILNIYKAIGMSQTALQTEQIAQFNHETNYGQDMQTYQLALNKALDSIRKVEQQTNLDKLFDSNSSFSAQTSADDYELISFLIIKD